MACAARAAPEVSYGDGEVSVAERSEHVLIGIVVAERDDRHSGEGLADPGDGNAFVKRAQPDLEHLDPVDALAMRAGLQPVLAGQLRGRDRGFPLFAAHAPPVQSQSDGLGLDTRAGEPQEIGQVVAELAQVGYVLVRRLPGAPAPVPRAVLREPPDSRNERAHLVDERLWASRDDGHLDAGRGELPQQLRGGGVQRGVFRARGER